MVHYTMPPESPRLHVVGESSPRYTSRHRTMIDDDVVEEVLQRCGIAAMGLYAYLERKANVAGQCWPSIDEMATICGCSRRYISELINEKLVPNGFVQREEQTNRFGRTTGVVYTLPYHRIPSNDGGEPGDERPHEHPHEPGGESERPTSSSKVDTEYLGVDTSKSVSPSPRKQGILSGRQQEMFDRWWDAYPRKVEKQAAIRAWAKVHPDPDLVDQMVRVTEAWAASKQWQDSGGKYIPYPSTWLNKGRWDDEIPQAKPRRQEGLVF